MIDFLYNNQTLTHWLVHYGSFVLFVVLALGILALPVPEETLMVVAGILICRGKLEPIPTVLAAWGGCMTGITMSYIVGRTAGYYLIHRYGKWVGLRENHLQKAHNWFERFGKWALVIGYFIPGVRHFTGLSAGATKLEYKVFALFAYVGVIIWSSTFISIGYFFGEYWATIYESVEVRIDEVATLVALVIILAITYYAFKKHRDDFFT